MKAILFDVDGTLVDSNDAHARAWVDAFAEAGLTVTSAKRAELEPLLNIAGAVSLLGGASSDDADESKPDPDIIHAALKKVKAAPPDAIMVGDTPYDIEAASRAGVKAIAFRCGGWNDEALKGAVAIYDGPWHLLEALDGGRVPPELT